MDKYKFVEDMLNERYKEYDVIDLRRCHLRYAMGSFNFRNDRGRYFWHSDEQRTTPPIPINVI